MSEAVDQHTLIAKLKDVAIELGRTPTKTEFFRAMSGGQYRVEKHFGSYSALVIAAGLDPAPNSRIKINNSVFERDIVVHLEAYKPSVRKTVESYQRTLFIPDTHFPFGHQPTLEKIYRFAEKEKPDVVVQVGDLFDAYSFAKFPKSANIFTPKEESDLARKQAEQMWREIQKAAPKARCVQICGNHDVRILKRILEQLPAAETWVEAMLKEQLTFDGVETITDTRQELMLPGEVAVIHGYKSQIGQHRDAFMYNVVAGHLHKGGVSYRSIRGRTLWELNCGLAGDPESKGLSYTPSRITDWTLGWGFLDEYGPRFIPA